jgi:hypothetical protein
VAGGAEVHRELLEMPLRRALVAHLQRHLHARFVEQTDEQVVVLMPVPREQCVEPQASIRVFAESRLRQRQLALRLEVKQHGDLVLALCLRERDVAGRLEHARRAYHEVLERTAQPDLAGLDASNHRFLRFGVMYGLAAIEAGMGSGASLEWARELESEPLHEVNALQVRVLY